MAKNTQETAAQANAALDGNVEDFYADRISYEEFTRRNGAIWDRIHARGKAFDEEVSALLRQAAKQSGPLRPRQPVPEGA